MYPAQSKVRNVKDSCDWVVDDFGKDNRHYSAAPQSRYFSSEWISPNWRYGKIMRSLPERYFGCPFPANIGSLYIVIDFLLGKLRAPGV